MRRQKTRLVSRRQVLSRIVRASAYGGIAANTCVIGYLVVSNYVNAPAGGQVVVPQTPNTSVAFTNPKTGKQGLIIRLPNGKLVTFQRACTHVAVYCNYDPQTHKVVCPAHGAIFDPAQGGKVLQGPATVNLPQIEV